MPENSTPDGSEYSSFHLILVPLVLVLAVSLPSVADVQAAAATCAVAQISAPMTNA
jgi:hypothetical protein